MSLKVKVTKLRIALTAIVVILVISMALSTKVVSLQDANTTFRTGTTSLQVSQTKSGQKIFLTLKLTQLTLLN
jgi:hypothetical protein